MAAVPGLLEGKVALISGIGPGMGRDIAMLFARHGASLVLAGRTEAKLEAVAAEVKDAGADVTCASMDVGNPDTYEAAFAAIGEEHGRLDVLVNNAFHPGDFRRFDAADLGVWRQIFDTNFFGTLGVTQAALPLLRASGDGRIVMINTMSSVRMDERYGAYTTSKAALATATKMLALELGHDGIRVNGVHPGYIRGESLDAYFTARAQKKGITFDEEYASVAAQTALGYIPGSEEIAGSVLFFASELSKPVTGQALGVNAGQVFQGF